MRRSYYTGATLSIITNKVAALRTLSSRIATKTLFCEDIGEDSSSAGQLVQAALATLSRPITSLLPRDLPGLPYRRFLGLITRFETQMRAIIQRKLATKNNDRDVLTLLLQARDEETGAALDEDALLTWVGSLFAADHERSGLAMSWTLFLLSQHPQIAADLLDELEGTLHSSAPTVEQLGQLPLLDAVIKESMRLIPPAPFTWRSAEQRWRSVATLSRRARRSTRASARRII